MLRKEETELEGKIKENLPNTTFRVETTDGNEYLCVLSGRMRMNHIRVLPGDRVKFVITPYDPQRGRIVYKLR